MATDDMKYPSDFATMILSIIAFIIALTALLNSIFHFLW